MTALEPYWLLLAEHDGEFHPYKLLPQLPLHELETELDWCENTMVKGWGPRLRLERVRDRERHTNTL